MHTLDKHLEASKIIRADGVDGLVSASRLVGYHVALGMLVMYLRCEFNQKGAYPDRPDTEERIRAGLKSEGVLSICEFNPLSGHGIIYNEDGKPSHVLDVDMLYQPYPAEGVHLGMWMQSLSDTKTLLIPAGKHPFFTAFDEMKRVNDEIRDTILRDLETQP